MQYIPYRTRFRCNIHNIAPENNIYFTGSLLELARLFRALSIFTGRYLAGYFEDKLQERTRIRLAGPARLSRAL